MKYYFTNLLSFIVSLKTNVFAQFAIILMAIISQYKLVIVFLLLLIITDLILGIWASYKKKIREQKLKLKFWEKFVFFYQNIDWDKVFKIFEKAFLYMGLTLIFGLIEYFFCNIIIEGYTITKIAMLVMCGYEVMSIMKNMAVISQSSVFNKLKQIFKKKLGAEIEKI